MFEYHGIQAGGVKDRKNRDKPRHYAPEQERIAPGVTSPHGPYMVRFRFHTEEAATQVDHFPCQEQSKPSETDKSSAPGFENELTVRRDRTVTVVTEIAVAETENYEGEGSQTEGRHPEAINSHINQYFCRKDANFAL